MTIEILELYKGKSEDKLIVYSAVESSCAFLPRENSEWLIMAYRNEQGKLGLGYCSGSEPLNRHYESATANENHRKSVELKVGVLAYLKKHNIRANNQYGIYASLDSYLKLDLKDREVKNEFFALYELTIDQNMQVLKVETIKSFDTPEVDHIINDDLKDFVTIYKYNQEKIIPKGTKILYALFYYAAEDNYVSFISDLDL